MLDFDGVGHTSDDQRPPSEAHVMFIISSYSSAHTGNGGHYYSLRELAKQMQKDWPGFSCSIVVIGDIRPPMFKPTEFDFKHLDVRGKSFRAVEREFAAIVKERSPTHVHAFDNKAFHFANVAAKRALVQRVLTKPGGPNAGWYFPTAPDIVCFSEENLLDLRRRRHLRTARFHLIPNRVGRREANDERVAALREVVGFGPFLLRIARIGVFHRRSILQTIQLAATLRESGFEIGALIIGIPEDQGVVDEVAEMMAPQDRLVTAPQFTTDAVDLLPIASAVLGTGRGMMEASLHGLHLFAPLASEDRPTLVTEENWRALLATNFSARSTLDKEVVPTVSSVMSTLRSGRSEVSQIIAAEIEMSAGMDAYRRVYFKARVHTASPWLDRIMNASIAMLAHRRTASRARRSWRRANS